MTYTITKNAKYNSLEVSFQSKPSAEVREALKALRFRWNGKAGIWYGYATEEAIRAAIEGKEAKKATERNKQGSQLDLLAGGLKHPPNETQEGEKTMNKKDKYSALSADLAEAYKAAIAIYRNHEDGGTCNFDAPALNLPRWIEEKTKQAAKAAGLNCWKWELWESKRFVFSLPVECGQGMRRTLIAEHMTRTLRGMGYDAMDYCQAD